MTFSIMFHYLCLLLFKIHIYAAKESVPLIVWDPNLNSQPSYPQFNIPSTAENVHREIENIFRPKNILLFRLDQLSVEDLSSFDKFKDELTDNSDYSLYVPSVDTSSPMEKSSTSKEYKTYFVNYTSPIAENSWNDDKNFIVVDLPPIKNAPNRTDALMKTVQMIRTMIDQLTRHYSFIFTAKAPLQALEAGVKSLRRSVRQAIFQRSSSAGLYNSQCVKISLSGPIRVSKSDGTKYSLSKVGSIDPIADCHARMQSMIILFPEPLSIYTRVSTMFFFGLSQNRWSLNSIKLDEYNGTSYGENHLYPKYEMSGMPVKKSFKCSQTLIFQTNATETGPRVTLALPLIQMEAFSTDPKFSMGFDCDGFFTIPILTGLLTGVLFLVILMVGMYMLSDIKTMDRFDDPKGKQFMSASSAE